MDRDLVQINPLDDDAFANDDDHRAEHFFYSDVRFPSRGSRRVAVLSVPQTFLDWGHARLQRPNGSPEELGLSAFGGIDDPRFVRHCAVNYLVKNFWHNFVHRAFQGITTENYREFRGSAREDSDFEADHLANLLLVRSFGLSLKANAKISAERRSQIEALFRRNRCNLVFAERAQHRAADRSTMSDSDRWAELEWRFCRGVSNVVSMTLISHGLATPSVRIFLTGDIQRSAKTRRTWRRGNVIAEVAGRRIATAVPAYIPDDELRAEREGWQISPATLANRRRFRQDREREIAGAVLAAYGGTVRHDKLLRDGLIQAFGALEARLALRLTS